MGRQRVASEAQAGARAATRGTGMADRCLLITWGEVVRGREERAIECFNDTVGLYGRLQQEGKIESFDVTLLAPNGHLDGFIQLNGTPQQLADVKEREDFQRVTAEATLIVDDVRLIDGYCNQGIAKQMELYAQVSSKVPQMA